MSAETNKIPPTCRACGNELSRTEMEDFVAFCERRGRDPVEFALSSSPPGVLCNQCLFTTLAEHAADGHPVARRMIARMRLADLGVEVLPGGKSETKH